MRTNKFKSGLILFFYVLLLCGCSVNTKKIDVSLQLDSDVLQGEPLPVAARWWYEFDDQQLNQLVELGLENNLSLEANLARIKSAESWLTVAGSNRYPDLNLSASAASDIKQPDTIETASFGLTSSWELDLWGEMSALEEKARWDLQSRQALYKTRANLVAGSITNYWFGWLAEHDKKRLLEGQYKRTETSLKVISRRFAMGKNSITDIWQQKRLLESIISQQAVNDARIATFEKQVALWAGIPIKDLPDLLQKPLPTVNTLPEFGVPLLALQQRPDIQQAFAVLQSNNASLAAAFAEKFPRLTLRGNYTSNKNSVKELFDDWSGNLIMSLFYPVFDAGGSKAKVSQREYLLDASYADYKQTWFDAIFAIEKVIIDEKQLYIVDEQLKSQLQLAKKTESVVSLKYLMGKSSYLALLRAQETSLRLERQSVDAQKALINNRITLYRELSHGQFVEKNNL